MADNVNILINLISMLYVDNIEIGIEIVGQDIKWYRGNKKTDIIQFDISDVKNEPLKYRVYERVEGEEEKYLLRSGVETDVILFKSDGTVSIVDHFINISIDKDGNVQKHNIPKHTFNIENDTESEYMILTKGDFTGEGEIIDGSYRIIKKKSTTTEIFNKIEMGISNVEYFLVKNDKLSCNACKTWDFNKLSEDSIHKFTMSKFEDSIINYVIGVGEVDEVEEVEVEEGSTESFWSKPGGIVLIILFVILGLIFLYYFIEWKLGDSRARTNRRSRLSDSIDYSGSLP